MEKPLQMNTAYGLNEKVIASAVSKSRKGYSTEDMIFIFPENVFFFFFFFFHFPVIMLVVK